MSTNGGGHREPNEATLWLDLDGSWRRGLLTKPAPRVQNPRPDKDMAPVGVVRRDGVTPERNSVAKLFAWPVAPGPVAGIRDEDVLDPQRPVEESSA